MPEQQKLHLLQPSPNHQLPNQPFPKVFLKQELAELKPGAVILALGSVAHSATLRALGLKLKDYPFGHGMEYSLDGGRWLLDSYHCSRYNTQTRRLTEAMFAQVFTRVKALIG